jgi:hypothetical protein
MSLFGEEARPHGKNRQDCQRLLQVNEGVFFSNWLDLRRRFMGALQKKIYKDF